jgi:hypothetical protein
MFYKLIGMMVWNGGKVFLRSRYGSTYLPKPLLIGAAVLAVAGGAALAAAARGGDDD